MKRPPELRIALDADEITIDNFAGGGGASTGMDLVLDEIGRHVDIAVNHDAEAIALHKANHPHTEHYVEDVFHIDIVKACRGRRVGFAWYSPDCSHHSKARGGKPFRDRDKSRRIRGLAWVIIKQAKELLAAGLGPRIIAIENVQEFASWGPLDDENKVVAAKKGFTFRRWWRQLQNLGYALDMWVLRGCDYGAPTTRERLFILARRDGLPIVRPKPTHGAGRERPWRTAADCIDWSIPCPSIFARKRPLAENTIRRIFEGIRRYVVDCAEPFIVPVNHSDPKGNRVHGVDEPLRTITASRRGDFAVSVPVIVRIGQTGGNGAYAKDVRDPLTTVTTKAEHLLVEPLLVRAAHGEREGQAPRARSVQLPLPTIVTTDNGAQLVAPVLTKHYGGHPPSRSHNVDRPLDTVVASGTRHSVSAAYLAKQNGVGEKIVKGQALDEPVHTITTKDQKAVVTATLMTNNTNNVIATSHLLKFKGTSAAGQPVTDPLHTVQAEGNHYAEVRAFLVKYYSEGGQWGSLNDPMGTITAKDRIGLVTVRGEDYVIVDIGLRMLTPRELFLAQGFPEDYKIDVPLEHGVRKALAERRKSRVVEAARREGRFISKTAQVRMCGNSVCPQAAAAVMAAQLGVSPRGDSAIEVAA